MAVLYRPIRVWSGDKYSIDDYNGTADYGESMKQTPVGIAIGALLFFYRLGTKLSGSITQFFEKEQGLSTQQKQDLLQIGDGINRSSLSAMEMLQESMRQQKFLYTKQ